MFRFLFLAALSAAILGGCDHETALEIDEAISTCGGRSQNDIDANFTVSSGSSFCEVRIYLENPSHVRSSGLIGAAEIAVELDVEGFEPDDPDVDVEARIEVCDWYERCCVRLPGITKKSVGGSIEEIVTGMSLDADQRRFVVRMMPNSGFRGAVRFSGGRILSRSSSSSRFPACY